MTNHAAKDACRLAQAAKTIIDHLHTVLTIAVEEEIEKAGLQAPEDWPDDMIHKACELVNAAIYSPVDSDDELMEHGIKELAEYWGQTYCVPTNEDALGG